MSDYIYKEAYFDVYCERCLYAKNKETESPCDECLEEPVNEYSHHPVNFKYDGGNKHAKKKD